MEESPLQLAEAIRAEAEVVENRPLGGGNRKLCLAVPGWPGAAPGQFVMLSPGALPTVRRDDPLLPRPMAVYRESPPGSAGGEPVVEILYKIEGRGTSLLAEAAPRERVRVIGPLGRPFPAPPDSGGLIIVGGGTGIASLYGLAERIAARPEVTVILGARRDVELMGREDFSALDVSLEITTEDGSAGERGRVTVPLARALERGGIAQLYCCGPTPMMQRCAELASEHGVPCVVSLENNMACGFGVCLGCAAPRRAGDYALVCRDGPVFDAADLAWEMFP
jgi:dihydroorotate dehydrogenase electron transfer subunit